jgi:hypothetical protein
MFISNTYEVVRSVLPESWLKAEFYLLRYSANIVSTILQGRIVMLKFTREIVNIFNLWALTDQIT